LLTSPAAVAKVTRDLILKNWSFTEPNFPLDRDYGSGYPSDPKCKEWISRRFGDPLFGYPNLVRFSWGPVKDIMKDKGVKVEWEADEEDEQHGAMLAFVRTKNSPLPSQPRFEYFETRKLKRVTKFCR
jgi:ribonuclease H2 subunit A